MNLEYWKQQIIAQRKQTSFRDFLKEIASWFPFAFYQRDGVITSLPKTDRIHSVVLSSEDFEASRDELQKKARVYDFEKTFFENYRALYLSIPLYNLFSFGSENAQYGDNIYNSRNVYLSNGFVHDCENILYSFYIKLGCSNVLNSFMVWDTSDNVYFGAGVLQSYNIFYARYIYNCNNIWFSSNLTGCSECVFCEGLENCSYYIDNVSYDKEAYFAKKKEILQQKTQFLDWYKKVSLLGQNHGGHNVHGNFIIDSEDVDGGSFVYNTRRARNVMFGGNDAGNENFYDVCPSGGGSESSSDFYAVCGAGNGSNNLYGSSQISASSHIFYSYYLDACSYCLGCIGLKNKSYCILNKQYTKEEWQILVDKIFSQMEQEPHPNPLSWGITETGVLARLYSKLERNRGSKLNHIPPLLQRRGG